MTRQATPAVNGSGRNGKSANASTGETAQISRMRRPSTAAPISIRSRPVRRLRVTFTEYRRTPWGQRMTIVAIVAASMTAREIDGFIVRLFLGRVLLDCLLHHVVELVRQLRGVGLVFVDDRAPDE